MPHPFSSLVLALPLATLLTGCAMTNTAAPDPVRGSALSGVAFGGQQTISGAKVYLLAANPAGYGSASLSLLTAASTGSTVDSIGAYGTTLPVTGGFNLAGDYDCTLGYALGASTSTGGTNLPGDEQVYLYVSGGNAGAGNNRSIGLLAALGPCNAPFATSGLVVNEITTVAAAYALSGFATDATHLSSSGSSLARLGLANAGLNSANLVSVGFGGLPIASAGITRPIALLYTLGNILAACVNGTSGNPNCSTLFNYTQNGGSTEPTETATAAINLAHNPWPSAAGMTALYGLQPGTGAPFAGGLSSQPNDFTLGLTYTGGGLNYPVGIAIDGSGNAWIANRGNNSISKFASNGAAISPAAGYTGGGLNYPLSIAIDGSGSAWIANFNGNSISKFASNGDTTSPAAGYTGGGLSAPQSIAIDGSGSAWMANSNGNSISRFASNGIAASPSTGYTGGGLPSPASIAIDGSGSAWIANYGNSSVSKFGSNGIASSPSTGYTGGGLSYPQSIAIDGSGSAWTASISPDSVSKFASNGIATSTGYSGGGLSTPSSIAIDGSGSAWIANYGNNSVSRFASSGSAISPSTGYINSGFARLVSIAIDGSGDVWTSNLSPASLTELIGAATPVVTPIAANLISPYSAPASKP